MSRILFVIPVYNEAENIVSVIDDIRMNFFQADIIVVDDCSTDRTLELLKSSNANYIKLPFNMGYSAGLQTGFKYALRNNYDFVIQFDGDGQHLALEALKLYEKINEDGNIDIVIGSRFLTEKKYNHSFFRKIGTSIFRGIIKLFCDADITDPTSGFQIINRKIILKYSLMGNYPEFPDANLIIRNLFEGYKIEEIDCVMRERIYGTSMHSGMWNPIKYMVKALCSVFFVVSINAIDRLKRKI